MQWRGWLLFGVMIAGGSQPVYSAGVDTARLVCQASNTAGGPCRFSTSMRLITVTLDVGRNDAKVACFGIISSLAQRGLGFSGEPWRLRIVNSGGREMALCPFPK